MKLNSNTQESKQTKHMEEKKSVNTHSGRTDKPSKTQNYPERDF